MFPLPESASRDKSMVFVVALQMALLKGLTDAVEPILIITIGMMVLVLALGVFLPLWDLSSVAKK